MLHHRWARSLAPLALVALLAVCGGSDDGSDGDGAQAASTTSTTSTTTSTTAPPTSADDTPGTDPTGPTVSTDPLPVSVLLVGDSVGFTLQEHVPDEVPGIVAVDGRALAGCGLILEGERPPEAVAAGAPPRYDDCAPGVAAADRDGLAADPDVVLLVSGAWEWSDHERDGRVVGPGDPGWTTEIRELLTDRVESLHAAGPTVALWVDPCGPDDDARIRQAWYRDQVLAPVAEETGAVLVDPSPEVCAGDGTPRADLPGVGDPRPDDGQHWSAAGTEWLWTSWLGPALASAGAG